MKENEVSKAVIGAVIDVHRELGPGLVEAVYEEAMCHELHLRGLTFERQRSIPLVYKGMRLSVPGRLDLIVANRVIVELKAKEQVLPLDKVKLLTYLRLLDLRVGLVINFHVERLADGVSRVVNGLAEAEEPDSPPDLRA